MAMFGRNKPTTTDDTGSATPFERLAGQDRPREDRTPEPSGASPAPERRDADVDRGSSSGRHRDADASRDRHGHDDQRARGGAASSREPLSDLRARQKEEYGSFSLTASFFGYLVTVGLAVLLLAILSATGAAIGSATIGSPDQAGQSAGTIGIVGAALLLVALAIAYYAGGYVAGRVARFGGGKQGVGVWVIGLVITAVAGIAGAIAGAQYNILSQLQLPSVPLSGSALTTGGLIALAVLIIVTLLAALLGGKAGSRWHKKVDRVGR